MNACPLFDYVEAQKRRDRGMALAAHAQNRKVPKWSDIAYEAIVNVARRQIHVHVDDVLKAGVPEPHHFNAWGHVWKRAIDNEIIQPSAERRPCTVDPRKNLHNYPVYFSRIYDPRCTP